MLPVHQLQGELAISVPRHKHPRATITAGKGWFPYFCCSTSFCTLRFALQALNDLFAFLNILYCPRL
jgi:hypothetical protein